MDTPGVENKENPRQTKFQQQPQLNNKQKQLSQQQVQFKKDHSESLENHRLRSFSASGASRHRQWLRDLKIQLCSILKLLQYQLQ